MWREYNPNPAGRRVGDCAVRAIAAALGIDWESAYMLLVEAGYDMADMPSADSVWGAVLRENGFYRHAIPMMCDDCFTAADFAKENPVGVYVLGFGGHVATIINGNLLDSWDSSNEIPVYYWAKKGA